MKIGLIGLGNMGSGMAANLLKAGHELVVYNRTASKAQALLPQGARYAAQPADACQGDAVITMLADDGALESVVFGDAGVISNLRKGATHISSSTISVALSEKWLRRTRPAASVLSQPRYSAGRRVAAASSSLQSRARRMRLMTACPYLMPSGKRLFASATILPTRI